MAGTTHTCPCGREIALHLVACKTHWYWVDPALRSRIWVLFRGRDTRGGAEHIGAVLTARKSIRKRLEAV